MSVIIDINALEKTYKSGHQALAGVSMQIKTGEIFALLGPNGAGKTTLISIVCGILNASAGSVTVNGHNIIDDYRQARASIGLVPQELALSMFETVWATVRFTRGLYGKPNNDAYLEQVLRDLSLWDKKDSTIIALSGGMKRRVLIAKALAHEPQILFLDEPTAGVDVTLRQEMWAMIHRLRQRGTTIILTTHYIDEAEEMADRIGIINGGKLVLVDEKNALMQTLGKKQLILSLARPLESVPQALQHYALSINQDQQTLTYTYSKDSRDSGIENLMQSLLEHGIAYADIRTEESSLEDIFVNILGENA